MTPEIRENGGLENISTRLGDVMCTGFEGW